jgi:hypothetical protein
MAQLLATGRARGWGRAALVDASRAARDEFAQLGAIALMVAVGIAWWLLFGGLLRWLLL